MVLELTEATGEGHVLGPGDVLAAQEQHLVPQQGRLDLAEIVIEASAPG